MTALYNIAWFIALILSIFGVFGCIGFRGLVNMFPEGRRWWHFPAQILALTIFAAAVLNHPFGT